MTYLIDTPPCVLGLGWNITGPLLTAFKNGTIKGFGMRDAIGSNLFYMVMDRNITIEVTTP